MDLLLFSVRQLLLPILVLSVLCGCKPQEGIRQYSVPKVAVKPKPSSPSSPATAGEQAWFFKLTGPRDDVLPQVVSFARLLKSLRFSSAGVPEYELPPGWKANPGPPPRYQTLAIPETEPQLELAISSLPSPGDKVDQYFLANINRWRGQLGLEPYQGEDWMDQARQRGELILIPGEAGSVAMVNLTGQTKEFGPSRMLAAIVLPDSGDAAQQATISPSAMPLTYETPEGWKPSTGNSMRLASLEAPHEAGPADISVTRFPGGGDLLANLNRWRQQVKLSPVDEAALKDQVHEITIGGRAGSYLETIGEEQGILAAIVPEGNAKWFFKLQGPRAAVDAEKEHFQQFLKSVKFEASQQDHKPAE
jgi:hypothetical protein